MSAASLRGNTISATSWIGTVATQSGATSACGDRCRRPHYRGAYFVNTKSFAFTRV
jgi:hypothetical protein